MLNPSSSKSYEHHVEMKDDTQSSILRQMHHHYTSPLQAMRGGDQGMWQCHMKKFLALPNSLDGVC